jgi:2-oxoglutarate ferredoxin oxidoreductase subunit delta
MAKITVDKEKCKGCLLCVTFCPKGLIKKSSALNKKGIAFVEFEDKGECAGCKMCAIICPECCIEISS